MPSAADASILAARLWRWLDDGEGWNRLEGQMTGLEVVTVIVEGPVGAILAVVGASPRLGGGTRDC